MRGEIFLLQDNNELLEMNERKYDSEDLLQSLLENYPKLLAGSQINPSNPRRWLLIRREMEIPDKEQGAGRWSIDHLFLDQDGVPTLVEVKRSSDTRTRREVVAQMLDYAANSIKFWEINDIISSFQDTCEQRGDDPDEFFANFIGDSFDQDDFWELVNANLRQGKIRMLFVADIIPPELQRIVEFMNEQMNPAEVIAVEVKQYTGQNLKTLVSRVVGQTMKAVDTKSIRSGKPQLLDQETIAQEKGVGDLFQYFLTIGKSLFPDYVVMPGSLSFRAKDVLGSSEIDCFNLIPRHSNSQEGLKFQAYTHVLGEYFGLDSDEIRSALPEKSDPWQHPGDEPGPKTTGFQGHFKSLKEAETFIKCLEKKRNC